MFGGLAVGADGLGERPETLAEEDDELFHAPTLPPLPDSIVSGGFASCPDRYRRVIYAIASPMKSYPIKCALWAISLLALLVSGCVSGSQVVTGTRRTPVPPYNVTVYTETPAGAETIGLVSANSTASLSWDKAKVQCIEKMREKAGAIGANGIVIKSMDDSLWEGQKMTATAVYVSK